MQRHLTDAEASTDYQYVPPKKRYVWVYPRLMEAFGLTPTEYLLLAAMDAVSKPSGGRCTMSKANLGLYIGRSERNVYKYLNRLKAKRTPEGQALVKQGNGRLWHVGPAWRGAFEALRRQASHRDASKRPQRFKYFPSLAEEAGVTPRQYFFLERKRHLESGEHATRRKERVWEKGAGCGRSSAYRFAERFGKEPKKFMASKGRIGERWKAAVRKFEALFQEGAKVVRKVLKPQYRPPVKPSRPSRQAQPQAASPTKTDLTEDLRKALPEIPRFHLTQLAKLLARSGHTAEALKLAVARLRKETGKPAMECAYLAFDRLRNV